MAPSPSRAHMFGASGRGDGSEPSGAVRGSALARPASEDAVKRGLGSNKDNDEGGGGGGAPGGLGIRLEAGLKTGLRVEVGMVEGSREENSEENFGSEERGGAPRGEGWAAGGGREPTAQGGGGRGTAGRPATRA